MLPEINTIINAWNGNTKQMINKDDKAIFVSVDQLFSNDYDEELFYKDEFHPNEKGYSLIADKVFKAIKEIDFERFNNEK
jgi:lysophospholipase L1-like esterase